MTITQNKNTKKIAKMENIKKNIFNKAIKYKGNTLK